MNLSKRVQLGLKNATPEEKKEVESHDPKGLAS